MSCMKNFIGDIIIKGQQGIKIKKILNFELYSNDLKFTFEIFNFFKINVSFFFISSNFLNSDCFIICRWEKLREKMLGYFYPKNLSLTQIEIQILKEIGKNNKNGLFQHEISNNFKLKSNYLHHLLTKLITLNLIKKFLCVVKINSKKSNAILLKPIIKYFQLFKTCIIYKKKPFYQNKETSLIKRIIKTLIRQKKNILLEKHLKYGVSYLNQIPDKINKRKMHRTWQKIRLKLQKANIFEVEKKKEKNTELMSWKEKKNFSIIIQDKIFWNSHSLNKKRKQSWEIIGLFSFHFIYIIKKIIKFYGNSGITAPVLLEKFRGYVDYKSICNHLHALEKFQGIEKNLEQFGRQKILIFKEKKDTFRKNKNFIFKEFPKLTKGVTYQTAKRRIVLLSWVKFHFIFLKDLGKKIALYEKKGLKKIDSKVVKRILRDLIIFKLLKVVKVYCQISSRKIKRFEFIVKRKPEGNQIRKIFDFLPLSCKNFKKRNLEFKFFNKIKINLKRYLSSDIFLIFTLIHLFQNSFLPLFFCFIFQKKDFFKKKHNKNIFSNTTCLKLIGSNLKKNRNFLINFKLYVDFDFRIIIEKRKNIIQNLKISDFSFFFCLNYIFLDEKKNPLSNIISQNFIFSEKKWIDKKFKKRKFKTKKKTKFLKNNINMLQLWSCSDTFYRKNLFKKKVYAILFSKKFKIKKNFIVFKEKFYHKFLIISYFGNKNDFSCSNNKWDCEYDVQFYSKHIENLHENSTYFLINFCKNSNSTKRRIKKLSSLVNIKSVAILFKEINFISNSRFLKHIYFSLFDFIKRSLEFPAFYFLFHLEKTIRKFNEKNEKISFYNLCRINKLNKNQKKIFEKKFFQLKFLLLNMDKFFKNLYGNQYYQVFYWNEKNLYFYKNFFLILEKSFKIEKFQNSEIFYIQRFLHNEKKHKKKKTCISEKIFFPNRIKKSHFFEKIDKNFIVIVPFFVKNFSLTKQINFFPKKEIKIYKNNITPKKFKNISTPLEVRVNFFFPSYTKDEICCFNKKQFKKTIFSKKKSSNLKFIKKQIFQFNKKKNDCQYTQKHFVINIFFFFLKIQKKSIDDFILFWNFFPKIFFNNKNDNKIKKNSIEKSYYFKNKRVNVKYFQKIKYSIFFLITKKPGLEKEMILFFFKNFPFLILFFEKAIQYLKNENRVTNLRIIAKSNFFDIQMTRFLRPSDFYLNEKIEKREFFFPNINIPFF